jgi:predicted transcriptional regulator
VPTRRLSVRKIKEVLRLRFELGQGQRAIARACSISQSTVHEYLKRAEAAKFPCRCQKVGTRSELKKYSLESHDPSSSFPNVAVLVAEPTLLCNQDGY